MTQKGGILETTCLLESFGAILKQFAAISCDFEAPRHVISGSRQMDRTIVLKVLEYMVYGCQPAH